MSTIRRRPSPRVQRSAQPRGRPRPTGEVELRSEKLTKTEDEYRRNIADALDFIARYGTP
jgi:hypothetical protein